VNDQENRYKETHASGAILGFLFAVFVSLFALDVFDVGYSFWETVFALGMHLIPTGILLVALILSWRWSGLGDPVSCSGDAVFGCSQRTTLVCLCSHCRTAFPGRCALSTQLAVPRYTSTQFVDGMLLATSHFAVGGRGDVTFVTDSGVS